MKKFKDMRQKLAEGFLGKDGEKGRDIKNAGLFDKETAYSLAKKVNGVIHKDPKSDKYHVKHGKGSNVSETAEFDESTAAYAASLEKMANDKKLKGITPKDRETLAKLAAMMKSANEGIEEAALKPLKKLKPRATAARDFKGKAMPEFDYKNRKGTANLHPSQYEKGAIAKAADANPMSANAKAVARTAAAQAAWAAEKAKMKEGSDVEEVKVPANYAAMMAKKKAAANKEKAKMKETVAKNTTFSTQNKNRKPSLGQNKLSSAEYQRVKKLKSFNKDDWKWNGDLYIRVEK